MARPDAARQIHFFPDDIVPQPRIGPEVIRVAEQRRDIGHSRRTYSIPDGMPDRLLLLEDGFMRLDLRRVVVNGETAAGRILGELHVAAALVEKILGEVEIFIVSGQTIELHEGELDLLVTGKAAAFVRAERGRDEVGILKGDVEKRPFSRRQIMGRGRFVEMAGVVKFVADGLLDPALGPDARLGMGRVGGPGREQVTVGLLGGRDFRDHDVERAVELRVGPDHERIRRALDHLVNVRVVISFALVFSVHQFSGDGEIVDAPGLFVLFHQKRNGHGSVGFDPRRPERVRHRDLGERHRPERIILFTLAGVQAI